MYTTELYIGGRWRPSQNGKCHPIFDPATGEAVGQFSVATDQDLQDAAIIAADGFKTWNSITPYERGVILQNAARLLREQAKEIAPHITRENGKSLSESFTEVSWASDYFTWCGEEARRIYGRMISPRRNELLRQMTVLEPVGPVLAMSPWNWPLVPLSRKVSAALAAGCSVIAKPSEETPTAAACLASVLSEAGVPDGVFNIVYGDPAHVSSRLIADPHIRKISFTGSVQVGKLLAQQAAAYLKPITLELGGHAPVILFEDIDIDRVVQAITKIKFRTAGQVCSSPTRFYVHENIANAFAESMKKSAETIKVGVGTGPGVEMGPLINQSRVDVVAGLVGDAVDKGAIVLSGGGQIPGNGYFYSPTILADVPDTARIMKEEPFGPVLPIARFSTYDEAIAKANGSHFALAAYVFTSSLEVSQKAARDIRCGNLGINTFAVSMAEAPFGGNLDSGYGREGGVEGVMSYLTTKFVAEAGHI